MRSTLSSTTTPNAHQLNQIRASQQALIQGRANDALLTTQRLVQELPRSPDVCLLHAMVLAEHGQFDESDDWFAKALMAAPGNALILSNQGQMRRRAGRLSQAIDCYRMVTQQAPSNPNSWLNLGQTQQLAGQLDDAIESLAKAVELKPDLVAGWHGLSQCYRRQHDYERAQWALETGLLHKPKDHKLMLGLGHTLRGKGDSAAALSQYLSAGAAGHSSPELMDARVGALLDLGRVDEALDLAKRVVNDHAAFLPGIRTLAELLWQYGEAVGEPLTATQAFTKAIATHPSIELRLELARFLLESRQYTAALQHIECLRSEQDGALIIAMQAHALEGLNRHEEAAPLYRAAWSKLSQNVSFLNDYCRHLIKSRDWDTAASIIDSALAIEPHNQEAWAYQSIIWRMLGDEREFWLCDYDRIVTIEAISCPEEYTDRDAFMAQLAATLDGIHRASREPVHQSLRNGSQTSGRLFGRDDPLIASAQRELTSSIERWLSHLPKDDKHPFLRRNQQHIRYSGSWSVKLWSSGKHVNHIHSQGWISSAFYVALPPSVQKQANDNHAGAIQFGQPPDEFQLNLAPRRIIQPKTGHVALFPSYMWHGTVPFQDDEPRVTMAFDMIPAKHHS